MEHHQTVAGRAVAVGQLFRQEWHLRLRVHMHQPCQREKHQQDAGQQHAPGASEPHTEQQQSATRSSSRGVIPCSPDNVHSGIAGWHTDAMHANDACIYHKSRKGRSTVLLLPACALSMSAASDRISSSSSSSSSRHLDVLYYMHHGQQTQPTGSMCARASCGCR